MRKLRSIHGFTIIELMIASSILLLLVSGLFSIMLYFGNSMKKTQQKITIEESLNSIRHLIKEDSVACTETLKSVVADTTPNSLQSIKTAKGSIFIGSSKSIGISKNLYLERFFIDDWKAFPSMSTQGTVSLNIEYKENKGSSNERTHLKKIRRIWVERLANNKISKCIPTTQSNCYPKKITLGSSSRSFDSITEHKPSTNESQESGTEIISIISKNKEHCLGHALCHDGRWENLSFCKDSRNNEYWAAEFGYTTNWNDIENFSTRSSVGGNCPAFRAALNCHQKCNNNPIDIPAGYRSGESPLGGSVGSKSCGPNSNNKYYYWKNLECNSFGYWQYDVIACGVLYDEENPPPGNREVHEDIDGNPIFVVERKKLNKCAPAKINLDGYEASLNESQIGSVQLWSVTKFYTILCKENGSFAIVSTKPFDSLWTNQRPEQDLPSNDPYTFSVENIDGESVTVIKKK